jgi:hypothetical protein
VAAVRGSVLGLVAAAVLGAGVAVAQSNLDAGKSAAQIFSDTCNACHRSPRELRPTSAGYLRDHYTTGPREAAAMAAYLASVGSDPRAVQQRRPPTLGAGQLPPVEPRPPQGMPQNGGALAAARPGVAGTAEPAKPAQAGFRPRRPSESIEMDALAPAAAAPAEAEAFEE